MDTPIAAYRGDDAYVFVCYAHKNARDVYADLAALHENGRNIWYDEGISAGTVWRGEIASAIKSSAKFVFYISADSLTSAHCLREVDYAISNDVEIVPVYLENCELPDELAFVLNRVQGLYRQEDSRYFEHLLSALSAEAPAFSRQPNKRRRHVALGFVASVAMVGLVALFLWQQNQISKDGLVVLPTKGEPSAFDQYLSGLQLMQRWDKGDNLDLALAQFSNAAVSDPSFALAFARMAEAQRIKYALTRDEKWLTRSTEAADEAYRLNPNLVPVQVVLGKLHALRGNLDLAVAVLERAVEMDPNDAIANQAVASIYERLGRRDEAESYFSRAVTLDPDNLLVLDAYANFLYEQGRFDEAAAKWQNVIRLAPDHYVAMVNLGSALNESGRVAEAITFYEKAIEIRPTYTAYSSLATANGRAARYPEAIVALEKALEIEDGDWEAWGNLGYAHVRMNGMDENASGAFDRAIALAEHERKENPRDPTVHAYLAVYYSVTNQPELAKQRLETALSLAPNSAGVLAAAAEVYELLGHREEAMSSVARAIQLGFPLRVLRRNPDLQSLLDALKKHLGP